MGLRGPRPTPSSVLRLRGTYRPGRRKHEARVKPSRPRCPAYLKGPAKRAWEQIVPLLQDMGVLTRLDRSALARYCEDLALERACRDFIAKHGRTYAIRDNKGAIKTVVPFPEMTQLHKVGERLRRAEAEFGLTPASRTRLVLDREDADEHDADPFADLEREAG